MRQLLFVSFCLLCSLSFAQGDFEPLQNEGKIPYHILSSSTDKYESAAKAIKQKKQSRKERKSQQSFELKTNFSIDEVIESGSVLYGDPITQYINKVAYEHLNIPSIVKFHTNLDPSVNAFATNQGYIFVNLGLIAQLETEAQLAFILAHEYIHYKHKHNFKRYENNKVLDKQERKNKKLFQGDERIIQEAMYSRDHEKEADEDGFKFFINSNYSLNSLDEVFDVLKYADLPINEIPLNVNYIYENEYIKLPATFMLDTLQSIVTEDLPDSNQKYSTHPSIPERRAKLAELRADVLETNRSEFLVGKDKFLNIRRMARKELCRRYIQQGEYNLAIYTANVLMDEEGESEFLDLIFMKGLYGLARFNNEDEIDRVLRKFDEQEGQHQQTLYITKQLSDNKKALNALALSRIWDMHQKYPENVVLVNMAEELAHCFYADLEDSLARYYTEIPQPEDSLFAIDTDSAGSDTPKSKYDKIKAQESNKSVSSKQRFYRTAFIGHLKDQEFVEMMKRAKRVANKPEVELTARQKRKKIKYNLNWGLGAGLNKVVMLDPQYLVLDFRKKEVVRYTMSEALETDLQEKLRKNAQKANLYFDVLSASNMSRTDTRDYNFLSAFKRWDNAVKVPGIDPVFSAEEKKAIKKRYGTKYFGRTYIVHSKFKLPGRGKLIAFSVMAPVTAPYFLYKALAPINFTYIYTEVLDIETGEEVFSYYSSMPLRNSNMVMNSHLYQALSCMKKPIVNFK